MNPIQDAKNFTKEYDLDVFIEALQRMMGVYEKGFIEDKIIGEIDREIKDMIAD